MNASQDIKTEIETHPAIAETKISDYSMQFKGVQTFFCILLIKLFC